MDPLTCPSCGTKLKARMSLSTLVKPKTKFFRAQSWVGQKADSLKEIENTYVPPARTSPPAFWSTPADMPGKRETPVRAPTIEADVLVPLSYAIIPAIPAAILIWLGWIMAGWRYPVYAVLGFFFSIALGFWLLNQGSWHSLLWRFEEWTGKDVDQDGSVGKPESSKSVIVQVWSGSGYQKRHCGLDEDQVQKVAQAILGEDAKFTRSALCKNRKCFPGDKYSNLIEMWEGLGMLERDGEHNNASVVLTDAGLSFLSKYHPPTPDD